MGQYKKLWYALIAVLTITFSILGYLGVEVYRKAPPFPQQYVSTSGQVLMSKEDILAGQSAWQSTGGMELGSILGHGAYQAPDWTADWLHRELVAWLDITAQAEHGKPYAELDKATQANLRERMAEEYRNQSRVGSDGNVVLSTPSPWATRTCCAALVPCLAKSSSPWPWPTTKKHCSPWTSA